MQGSPLPIIPIQPLVAAGIFGKNGGVAPDLEWEVGFPGTVGWLRLIADNEVMSGQLCVMGISRDVWLPIGVAPLQYGQRRYWLCHQCQSQSRLLVGSEMFLCKACYRKERSRLSPAHRNALLVEAEDALKAGHWFVRPKGALVGRKPLTIVREKIQLHDLETQTAIDRGHGCNQHAVFEILEQMPEDERLNLPTAAGYVRPGSIEFLDRAATLNINVLWQNMASEPSSLTGQTLQWSDVAGSPYMAVFLDRRGPEPLLIIAHDRSNLANPQWQRLLVHHHESGRRRFICPITGRRYDDLYLRDGIFASRDALRLIHPKQRQRKRKAVTGHD